MFNTKKHILPSVAITAILAAFAPSAKADVTGTATNITTDLDVYHYSGEFHLVNGEGEKWVKVHTDISLDPSRQLNAEQRISSNLTVDWILGYGMIEAGGEYTMYSSAHWRYPDSNGWRLIDEDTDTGIAWY